MTIFTFKTMFIKFRKHHFVNSFIARAGTSETVREIERERGGEREIEREWGGTERDKGGKGVSRGERDKEKERERERDVNGALANP